MWNPHEPVTARQRVALGIIGVLAFLALWAVLSGTGVLLPSKMKELATTPEGVVDHEALDRQEAMFLPTPWDVGSGIVTMVQDDGKRNLGIAAAWSARRVGLALLLVLLVGLPVGILMGSSSKVNALLSPCLDPLRAAPVVALLPVVIIWFGTTENAKVVFLWMGASVFFIPMVRDAIVAVGREHLVLAEDLGASPFEAIRHSVVPLAMPRIFDAVIVAVGIEWTYITVAEYVKAEEGLGYLVMTHGNANASAKVYGVILVILALALITDQALKFAKRKLFPWETE